MGLREITGRAMYKFISSWLKQSNYIEYDRPKEGPVVWQRRGARVAARHSASRGRALELPWERKRRKWATLSPLESAAASVGHLMPSFLFSPPPALLLSLCPSSSFPLFCFLLWLGVSRPSSQDCIRFGLNEMRFIYIYPAYSSRRCSGKNARNFKAFKWLNWGC